MSTDALGLRVSGDPDPGRPAIVSISGDVDIANAHHLTEAFEGVADRAIVVVDFSSVDYMDSSGMTVLIVFGKRLGANGGKLILAGLQPPLARLFELAGLSRLFTVVASIEDIPT